MRVALITDGIWPYVLGGMQKHSYYLCKYLAKNNIQVDLVHFNNSSYEITKLEFFSEQERAYINSIVVDFPTGDRLPGHYLRRSYLHSKLIFDTLKEKLPTYDFIYTKGFTGWQLINEKKAGRIKCAKIGVKFHGYEMFQRAPDFKTKLQHLFLLRKPVREISQNADVVFSYGGKITDIIKSIGVPSDKIIELPSGVEESILALETLPVKEKIKILYLGRYERRKGIEELNSVIPRVSNVEFHFIGPIPDDKKIIAHNIIYHGEIRDKNVLNTRIKECDVLICPSWSEGMPNVILEAMANGLAVAATDVGATNILVNQNTGWLMNSSSVEEITKTISNIVSSTPAEIESKKRGALNLIREKFVWEKLAKQLIQEITDLNEK